MNRSFSSVGLLLLAALAVAVYVQAVDASTTPNADANLLGGVYGDYGSATATPAAVANSFCGDYSGDGSFNLCVGGRVTTNGLTVRLTDLTGLPTLSDESARVIPKAMFSVTGTKTATTLVLELNQKQTVWVDGRSVVLSLLKVYSSAAKAQPYALVAVLGGGTPSATPTPATCPDANSDGVVDLTDLAQYTRAIGSVKGDAAFNSLFDLDQDGKVSGRGSLDFMCFQKFQLAGCSASVSCTCKYGTGDLNGDGRVDSTDLALYAKSVGTCKGQTGYDASADFDASGCVEGAGSVDQFCFAQAQLKPIVAAPTPAAAIPTPCPKGSACPQPVKPPIQEILPSSDSFQITINLVKGWNMISSPYSRTTVGVPFPCGRGMACPQPVEPSIVGTSGSSGSGEGASAGDGAKISSQGSVTGAAVAIAANAGADADVRASSTPSPSATTAPGALKEPPVVAPMYKQGGRVIADTCAQATLWYYNPESRRYENAGTLASNAILASGRGYWFKASDDCAVTISGSAKASLEGYRLVAGWNQIGAPGDSAAFTGLSASCSVTGGPWKYDAPAKQYVAASTLQPGEGYFVKVSDSCTLGASEGIPPLPQ